MNNKKLDTGSRDAISCLPDEILGDILSLLPLRQAASTCILSKKWRHVFRLVPKLDFDESVSLHREDGKPERGESFKNFLERTHCGSPIKKFSLKRRFSDEVRDRSEVGCLRSWICDAVEHGVLKVEIRIENYKYRECFLPCQLFTSKVLVKLTIGTDLFHRWCPSYVCVSLPSLKILFIDTVSFEDKDLSDVLLAGCPVLEELIVHHNDEAVPHTIVSPSVKRLSLDYISSWKMDDGHLSLHLPNLVYLYYSGFALSEYPQANLDSLVEAELDLHRFKKSESDLTNLIVGIRNVEILHLSGESVDVIYRHVKCRLLLLPMFSNLVKLSFGSKNKQGWKLLAHLFKQSPKLETLIIQDLNGYTGDVFMALNKVKVLHVLGYRGTSQESQQLKSLLGQHKCLEVVQVSVVEEDDGRLLQIKSDLMMLLGVSLPSKFEFKVA